MNPYRIALGIALLGLQGASAQPDVVENQAWMQIRGSQMKMMMDQSIRDGKGEAGLPVYLSVYMQDKILRGPGHFRFQEGSKLMGTKESGYIRMEGMNIYPETTDSIECLGETGIKGERGWLFRTLRGRISAYSPLPAGPATHFSFDGGPIREMKEKEIEKILQTTPIAYAFLERDRDYALDLFNKYHVLDVYDAQAGLSLYELRRCVLSHAGDWAKEKAKPSDGLIVRIAKIKYSCQNRKYDDGLGALGELEEKFPELYLLHDLEGECYEKQGNRKAAIEAYMKARTYAPDDPKLVYQLSQSISRLR